MSKEPEPPAKVPPKNDAPLKEQLEKAVGEIIPKNQRTEVIRRVEAVVTRREQFSGPLPHPTHLKQYEEVCPGAADRIIALAERQQTAEIAILNKDQADAAADRKLGMWLGFVAFLALVAGAIYCGTHGQPILAGAFVAAGALGAVGLFIKGRDGQ